LVKQILTFSRQNEQERHPTQLGLVIKEALKLLRATVPVTIEFKSRLAEVPTVLAAPTQIHQIIMNLGTNAWHAMRDQAGVLEVTLAPLQVDTELARLHPDLRPGPYVKLSISDTGCGMSRATLERIFDPFFTTKGPGEGTGLGLAVVHGIMKSHDGTITVYSEPGKGTVFHLYFPAFEADPGQTPTEQAAIPQGHGVRVLFVDDEEALTRVGRTMLERLGYHVTTQTGPLQALALFRARPQDFDLVLTDYTMPGMTGLQLTRQLLAIRPDIPVILTTGYSAMLTPDSLQDAGIRELILKPYNTRILGEAFHQVLSRAGRARPV
jgi:CheY-like chemotaxis protein